MILYGGGQSSASTGDHLSTGDDYLSTGDYLSLNLVDGVLQLRYDLGSGSANIVSVSSLVYANKRTHHEINFVFFTFIMK